MGFGCRLQLGPIRGWHRTGCLADQERVSPLQRSIYRGTRGRVSLTGRLPVLLLTTTGHHSGKPRTVPVFYLRSGDSFVICNVRPPGERANPWVSNVRADPKVSLEISGLLLHQGS